MKPRPLLALLAAAAAGSVSTAWADDAGRAEALLAQSRTALGGAALDRRGALEVKAQLSLGGLSGTATSWGEIGGRRAASTGQIGGFSQSDGYDGRDVWNRDDSGLVWVDGGDAGRAEAISLAFVDNYTLWSPGRGGAAVNWGGSRSDAGRDYDILQITAPKSAAPFDLWFDANPTCRRASCSGSVPMR
jgi:hypothetical protein